MKLTWALESLVQHYRKKPLHYLGMLIGHEGKGSLVSYLREQNWAHAIESGVIEVPDEFNTACSCFQVSLTLTKEGMACFENYLKLLSIKGFHKRFWDESFQIERTKFRFLEQIDPMKYVEQLARDMHRYQPQDYIIGNLMIEYDEQLLQCCLEALKPDTMNIALWSEAFKNCDGSWCEEKWFKTAYLVQDIPQKWMKSWTDCDCLPELSLPEPNVYIATDFRLKSNDCSANYLETPLTDTDVSRLWFCKDEEFLVPKASINFFLKSCEADKSPSSSCMLDLYVELLRDHIAQVVYPAELAEISCRIVALDRGLIVCISGFSHKLTRLFVAIVDRLATFQVREDLFCTLKQDLKGFYKNSGLNPEVLNKQLRRSLLFDCHWDVMRKYECISAVTLESFTEFVKSFYSQMYVEGLVQGNITSKKASSVESFLLGRLGIKATQNPEYLRQNQVKRIPPGCSVFTARNKSTDDENSVITNYYQYGKCNLREFLINQIILTKMEEPCFACLRTSKQLGYHVTSGSTYLYGVVGFTITICSLASKCSMQVLDDSIEEFLRDFHKNHIEKMTEKALFEIIAAEIRVKQNCGDASLQAEVDRRWKEILENSYVFDRPTREINELKTITLRDIKLWSRNFIAPESKRRKLSIQVVGNDRLANDRQRAPRRQPGSKRPPLRFPSPSEQPTTYPNPRPTTFPIPRATAIPIPRAITSPNPGSTIYPNPRVFTSIEEFKSECERF